MTTVYQQQWTAEHNSNIQLYTLCTCKIYMILHNCSQQGYQQNWHFVLFNWLLLFISTEGCNVRNGTEQNRNLQYRMFKKGQTWDQHNRHISYECTCFYTNVHV